MARKRLGLSAKQFQLDQRMSVGIGRALASIVVFLGGLASVVSAQTSPKSEIKEGVVDDHVFIWDGEVLRVSTINTLALFRDVCAIGALGSSGGFDDGHAMVFDTASERIFVSDHDFPFRVFDTSLDQSFPTFGVSLREPLGIAPLPNGQILITDEEGSGAPGNEGLFRLNADLTFDASATGSYSFNGAEGVVHDPIHDRIFVADEDDRQIEIFNGSTLAHVGTVDFCSSGDGVYALAVDGSSNHLFALAATGSCPDSASGTFGIHVLDIISGGDDLLFNTTLLPESETPDCFGALAVSESADRLFAIDFCNNLVLIYDTVTLEFLGTVPGDRAGGTPLMVSVGHLFGEGGLTIGCEDSCDSGYYILDSFGGRHRVGNPPIIEGSVYFNIDIARDLERAACERITRQGKGRIAAQDLIVLDGFGAAQFVENPGCSIPQDFYFFGQVAMFPQGRAVDLEVTADSGGFWVLTDYGEIYRAGTSKAPTDPAALGTGQMGVLGFDVPLTGILRDPNLPEPGGATLRAVSLVIIDENQDSRADGYVVLDSMGGRFHFGADGIQVLPGSSTGAQVNDPELLLDPTAYAWPFFPGLDIARDIELHPTQQGVVILDGWGGIHPVPDNRTDNPVFFANNLRPDMPTQPITTTGMPYLIMGFDDPSTEAVNEGNPNVFGIDAASIFVDLDFSAGCDDGFYTLDRFGAVFVFGSAREVDSEPSPQFQNTPYFFPHPFVEDLELFSADEREVLED